MEGAIAAAQLYGDLGGGHSHTVCVWELLRHTPGRHRSRTTGYAGRLGGRGERPGPTKDCTHRGAWATGAPGVRGSVGKRQGGTARLPRGGRRLRGECSI